MPKTAVREDRHFKTRPGESWSPRDVPMPAPPMKPARAQGPRHRQFGRAVPPRKYRRHNAGARGAVKDIRHSVAPDAFHIGQLDGFGDGGLIPGVDGNAAMKNDERLLEFGAVIGRQSGGAGNIQQNLS